MANKDKSSKVAGAILMVLSILLLAWTVPLLLLSGGSAILEHGLRLAGSPLVVGDLDEAARGYLSMAMLKPLWEEIWIGVFGIYCAFGIRRGLPRAWTLGLFWGVMLITNAVIQGSYELVVLGWSSACLQTFLFLALGGVAVASLLISRRQVFRQQPRRVE